MARQIGEVWVQIPTGKIKEPFSYEIPEKFSFLAPGWRVLVPWGTRLLDGVLLAVREVEADFQSEFPLKEIVDIFDDSEFYSENDIKLARWFSKRYFCTLGDAMRLFVPSGKEGKDEKYFSWNFGIDREALSVNEIAIAEWIQKNQPISLVQLKNKFSNDVVGLILKWVKEKRLFQERKYKRVGQVKKQICYELTKDGHQALEKGLVRGKRQVELLECLKNGVQSKEVINENGISLSTIKGALEKGWISEAKPIEIEVCLESDLIRLNKSQEGAFEQIQKCLGFRQQEFLLFGITGSGKTEIYLKVAEENLKNGKGTIVLTPEIALTSQLIKRFEGRFGKVIAVFHSEMSLGEKRTAWEQVRNGDVKIVIGARSALFAPLKDIGAIILDEEHEFTYKQEEFPRYHARDVARERARLEKAVVLFGSATPSLESYYRTRQGEACLLELPERIGQRPLPEVAVVDMREELKKGNRTILSQAMRNLISNALDKKEQIILLMNRRGFSTFVMCRECGYVAMCKDCNVSLVYHQKRKTLECHYCHAQHSVPEKCPECQGTTIRFFGSGTEKVEEVIRENYPGAKVARLDRDSTARKGSGEEILANFRAGRIDILIGTQMVAKGHDIPNVTAIGIISADTVLNLPDFRASEQTFSLLTQAAGRAGRGDQPGKVVVQTYSPLEPSIIDAARQDYSDFAERELQEREVLSNPPYSELFKCTIFQSAESVTREVSLQIADELRGCPEIEALLGPYPEVLPYQRSSGKWYQHLLIKTANPDAVTDFLLKIKEKYSEALTIDRNPLRIF